MRARLGRVVACIVACGAARLRAAAAWLERQAGLPPMAAIPVPRCSAGPAGAATCDTEALASWQTGLRALSHDLRVPQSAILALAELQQPAPQALAHAAFVAQVAGHAQASLRLTDDIARLLRELAHPYRMEVLDLAALLREAADTLWQAGGPGLELGLAGARVWIRGDAAMLGDALRLLMAMALAAAGDARPHVRLHVRQQADGRVCRIAVACAPVAADMHAAHAVAMQFCRRVLLRHGGTLEAPGSVRADASDAASGHILWRLQLPILA